GRMSVRRSMPPDLTTHTPHGLDAELEGYAWLPRMLDKARATLAGTAGEYQFGCPVDQLQQTGSYLRVRRREEPPEAEGGRLFSGDDHGASVSVVLIDAAPHQAQEPHAHTVEEVVVVEQGAARFFLGQQQARIVR